MHAHAVSIETANLSSDAAALRDLLNAAYGNGGGECMEVEPWLASILSDAEFDPELCLAATSSTNGRLVGFLHAWTTGFIKDLAVDAAFQRHGVGRALMTVLADRASRRGIRALSLKVVSTNDGARRFYRSLGLR